MPKPKNEKKKPLKAETKSIPTKKENIEDEQKQIGLPQIDFKKMMGCGG